MSVPRALTIAGSDSGGGAGIQADLKAFAAAGVYGMSAIVALTAQNTVGVTAVHEVPVDIVTAQIAAVFDDLGVDAVKTGMLGSRAVIDAVAAALEPHGVPVSVPLVGDPVDHLFDGTHHVEIPVERLAVAATHGAGCTHSATLAALLARRLSLEDAARGAARAATDAVRHGLAELGAGDGPVDILNVKGHA